MSDRQPLPSPKVEDADVARAQRKAELLFGDSPRRIPSPEPVPAPPRPSEEAAVSPSRNWDRLTYGGFGGWFKRLFSSSKRAQHRAEVEERRAAWAQDQQGILGDPGYRPDISLVKSNWAGKKMRQQRAQIDPDFLRIAMRHPHEPGAAELIAKQGMLDRLDFFRTKVEEVDDSTINPGPSRNRPGAGRSILKQSAPGISQRVLSAPSRANLEAFEANRKEAFDAESDAWQALPSSDAFDDAWLKGSTGIPEQDKSPENLAYIEAFGRSYRRDKFGQQWAARLNRDDQGDLAFPSDMLNQADGRQRALAFHQGYWKREQEVPKPTKKASHDRRVRFAEGSEDVEPLLNTPGNMPDEGKVVDLDADGMPAQGRILPTGAYEYPAADPSLYGEYGAPMRTQFNRRMAERPELLDGAARDEDPTFSQWARSLNTVRNRPSMSARSRQRALGGGLGAAESARIAAQGEQYHMTRDEGLLQPQANDGGRSESVSSQGDLDSNQANVSEPDEDS